MISRLYGINIKHTRFPCSVFFVRANVSKIQHLYSAKTSGIFNSKALPKVYSISQLQNQIVFEKIIPNQKRSAKLKIIIYEILPLSISYTTSARFIVDFLWDTSSTVLSPFPSFNDFRMIPSFSESRLLVGSSSRINGAS